MVLWDNQPGNKTIKQCVLVAVRIKVRHLSN